MNSSLYQKKAKPDASGYNISRRDLLALAALSVTAGAPGISLAFEPQGQLIWAAHPLSAERAVARLPDVLWQRHRRGLDRAEAIRREGRRGRVQEGADRRRALQIRVVQSRYRAGARRLRRVLAQAGERQTRGDQ